MIIVKGWRGLKFLRVLDVGLTSMNGVDLLESVVGHVESRSDTWYISRVGSGLPRVVPRAWTVPYQQHSLVRLGYSTVQKIWMESEISSQSCVPVWSSGTGNRDKRFWSSFKAKTLDNGQQHCEASEIGYCTRGWILRGGTPLFSWTKIYKMVCKFFFYILLN